MPEGYDAPGLKANPYTLTTLYDEHVEACCRLEALAFNRLRDEWQQPSQPPRRHTWMQNHIRVFPQNNLVAQIDGEVIGFGMTHRWGSLGWVGPIVVDPDQQGHGLGHDLIIRSRCILEEQGCQTIGLETWPHFPRNVALYIKTGFAPVDLISILEKNVAGHATSFDGRWLSEAVQPDRLVEALTHLSGSIAAGLDYHALIDYTLACQLGDVAIWGPDDRPEAAVVIHFESYAGKPAPSYASAELLIARPGKESHLDDWLTQLEGIAASAGRTSLRLPVPGRHAGGLGHLIRDRGYRLVKTRLRMAYREQPIPAEYVNYLSYAV